MLTMTALPDARTATVSLGFSDIDGITRLIRSDTNGTHPVRLRPEDLAGTGPRALTDHEPALSGWILYRAQTAAGEVARAWVMLKGAERPRFIIPALPLFSVVADSVDTYTASRESRSKFHDVINRSSPLVIAGRMATRTGQMSLTFSDHSAAKDLEDVLDRGQTVMFRQFEHPGMDMYFHSDRVTLTAHPEEEEWNLDISFREVSHPAGNVLSRQGWTFNDLARSYSTFDEVAQAFGSFHDLTVGRTE